MKRGGQKVKISYFLFFHFIWTVSDLETSLQVISTKFTAKLDEKSNPHFLDRLYYIGEQNHRFELLSNATHDSPLKEYPAVFKNVSHITVTSSVLPNCVRDLLVNDYIVRLLPVSLNPEYDPFHQHHGRFPFQKLRSVSD